MRAASPLVDMLSSGEVLRPAVLINFDEMKESDWIDLSQYERPTEDLLKKGKLQRKNSLDSNWSRATSVMNDTVSEAAQSGKKLNLDFEAASVIDEMAEPVEQIVLDDDLDQRKREIKAQNQKEDWYKLI